MSNGTENGSYHIMIEYIYIYWGYIGLYITPRGTRYSRELAHLDMPALHGFLIVEFLSPNHEALSPIS